ncbi:PAS domain-containing protein, partial [Teichococcus vastitatis]|uniref:PAS domain-containing protein n=1 Tax=Teichococcus vastitatis TaxID=2307076 RepID=UPI00138FEAAD
MLLLIAMTSRFVRSGSADPAVRDDNQSPAALGTFYDVVPVGLCLLDRDLRFVSLNRRMAEMTGRSAVADIGRTPTEVMPGVAEQLEPHLRQALRGEQVFDLELQGNQFSAVGEGRVYLASLEPARDENGSVVGVLCSALDITDRRRAEEALWEHRERLSNLIGQAAVGIAQTDLQGRFLLVNDCYCSIVGQDRDALLSKRMQDITHPKDEPANAVLFARLAKTGEPFSLEKRYVRPDGTVVWVNNYVSATRDSAGRPQYMVAIV